MGEHNPLILDYAETVGFLIIAGSGNQIKIFNQKLQISNQLVLDAGTVKKIFLLDQDQTICFFPSSGIMICLHLTPNGFDPSSSVKFDC